MALVLCTQLNAQTTDTTKTLKEVVITYQASKKTPVTYQNISSKEIKEKSVGQEPSFILATTPSITNYSDAGSSQGYTYYRIRGIDQTRVNTTFDGMMMNEPEDQGAYFSNYPDILNSVSKIQIQRGVGTTKNGTASYAGSIQLYSPNLIDSTKSTVGLTYGSFNTIRTFAEYNSGVRNKNALYIRASKLYSDGYKYNSSNNSESLFLSAGHFNLNSIWKFNFMAGNQKNDMAWIGVSDSLININPKINGNSSQEKDKFFQTFSQIHNTYQINKISSLQTSMYYTYLNGTYDFDFNNFIGLPSTEELYNYALKSNLIGLYSNYVISKNNLNFTNGLHTYVYNRQHTGSEKSLGQLYQNTGYKNEYSLFSKIDYTKNNVMLFADIQYRKVNFKYVGSTITQNWTWTFINPKAGLTINLNNNSTIYFSSGYTGREPTRNDMFGGNDDLLTDSTGNAILFNTKPEYVLNHELGYRLEYSKLSLNANFYYMDFKNEIVLNGKFGPNSLALTDNVEQSFRTGIELTLLYKLNKNFSLVNNSSFNYSRIIEQKEKFSPILTPPIIVNQEIIYTKNKFECVVSGRYQHKSFIDFANSTIVKSYVLLNSKIAYNFNKTQLSFFVNNITNTRYFNHGYVDVSAKYFVQAPINFFTSIQFKLK